MLGTMIFVLVGTGVNCQLALSADANLSPSPKGSFLGSNFAWACGLWQGHTPFLLILTVAHFSGAALGVWVGVGVSGGHINPTVLLHQLNRVANFLTSTL
jgi:aquaglyceroporin related protein, other eukaryote